MTLLFEQKEAVNLINIQFDIQGQGHRSSATMVPDVALLHRPWDSSGNWLKKAHFESLSARKAEGRRQKAEGRRQKAEGRRQKAEGRRQNNSAIIFRLKNQSKKDIELKKLRGFVRAVSPCQPLDSEGNKLGKPSRMELILFISINKSSKKRENLKYKCLFNIFKRKIIFILN